VGFVGDLLADLGSVRLAVGVVHLSQECRAFAHQVRATSEQVAGGAPLRRRDISWWKPAAAEPRRNLVRIELVVFGLAAVHGFHGERMPQHAGDTCCGTEVGEPVPGEETLDGHDQAVTIRRNSLEKRFRRGFHVAVEQHVAIVAHDADVHTPGMQVDTTVKGVLLGVESHGGLLLVREWLFPKASIPLGYAAGEASIIIKGVQATASSLRSCVAPASSGA
jgi:hypothetical protein